MEYKTYYKEGHGDTGVLFIHGFLGSPKHFEGFLPLIPKEYSICNLLLAGHGGSVREFSKASMAEWQRQAEEAVQWLAKRCSCIYIVAHSMGTFFAMDAAVKHPHLIKGLLLIGSPLAIGVKPTAAINSLKSIFNLISDEDEIGKAYQASHSVKLDKRLWLYIGWIPRYLELFRESARARETVKKVGVPCLFFQSKRDELVSMRSVRYIPKLPSITLCVLPHSRHFIYDKGDFAKMTDTFRSFMEE